MKCSWCRKEIQNGVWFSAILGPDNNIGNPLLELDGSCLYDLKAVLENEVKKHEEMTG